MAKTYFQHDVNAHAIKDRMVAILDRGGPRLYGMFWILSELLGMQNLTADEPSETLRIRESRLVQVMRTKRPKLERDLRMIGECIGNLPSRISEPTGNVWKITIPKSLIFQSRRSQKMRIEIKNKIKRKEKPFSKDQGQPKQPVKIDKGLEDLFGQFNEKFGTNFKQGEDDVN